MARKLFNVRPILPKLPFGFADVALFFGLFIVIYESAKVGRGMVVEFRPPAVQPVIDLSPWMLPYYAARSTLRMFIALGLSILFSLAYGYIAAKHKKAEQVMIPILDILQSVPVLAFLTVVTDLFIGLFPNSLLGLELASIFAVFTGQAWNMTFSFYHSMITLPKELDEAANIFGFGKWKRFKTIEVPASMIGLVWNAMMSFGGGWFFVAVSEIIQPTPVGRHGEGPRYALPGIGAYAQKAIETGNIQAILYASLAMLVVIVLVDQFFWRPVVAWSEKFKLDTMASTEVPTSWVLDLLYAARLPRMFNRWWRKVVSAYRKTPIAHLKLPRINLRREPERGRVAPSRFNSDVFFGAILGAIFVTAIVMAGNFVSREVSLREIGYTFLLGIITLLRVMVLVVLAGLVWTPVGVWIGLNPKLARISQPVVQFLSSFPAVLVFPFFTILFIRTGVNMNIGAIILMALGTQWYILFNSIAGAFKIPTTLRDMSSNMGLRGWLLWKRLILPAIFPSWVTGAITASGGAWNASIIAEVTEWNKTKLTASGLGSYIVNAHDSHDIARMVLGVTVMCVFVVGINRFFWRRLYALAEEKYLLA